MVIIETSVGAVLIADASKLISGDSGPSHRSVAASLMCHSEYADIGGWFCQVPTFPFYSIQCDESAA